jgi:hypothetical protein
VPRLVGDQIGATTRIENSVAISFLRTSSLLR